MNRLFPPSPSSGFLRVLTVSLLSFALLTMPLAGTVSAITLASSSTTAKADSNIESKLFVDAKSPKESPLVGAKSEASYSAPASPVFLPAVNVVTATLAATLVGGDADSDGLADPGDTISYTVKMGNNSGSDATGLSFSNPLDAHTTLVPGTLNSTPVAFDQTFPADPTKPFLEDSKPTDPANPLFTPTTITLSGQDPDGNLPAGSFSIVTGPTHGTLGSLGTVTCAGNGVCSATVDYTPTAEYFGTDLFTFKVNDGTANSNEVGTVSITVTGINDAPTFTQAGGSPATPSPFNPPAVLEDKGAQSVASFIINVSPGPSNESGQTVTFPITNNSNSALFSAQPSINVSGNTATLTYTSALNKNGTAVITYHAHDTGGTANGGVDNSADKTFTITINPDNDPPVYSGAPKTLTVQSMMKITNQTGLLTGVTDPDAADVGFSPQTLQVDPTTIDLTNCKNVINGVTYNCIINVTDVTAGNFDFDPPPGIGNGTVLSFTYKIKDNGNPGPGVLSAAIPVSVTVNGPVIWFVNPAAASNGIGTLSSPFKLLASATDNFHLGNLGTDQRVFVYSGTTEVGVGVSLTGVKTTALINQAQARTKAQWLIGEGTVAGSFDTLMGILPPTGTINRPTLNSNASTANGKRPIIRGTVTMKENTFVSGVNIDVSAGGSIGLTASGLTAGTTPSVLNVSDVNVTSAGGNAVDFFSNNAQTVHYTTSDATNSPNIIVSGVGTALRVSDTTIGSSGFTFRSISANGGTNGILLNNTGSTAGLTILGTGGTCTTAVSCTGGAIQNESGAGISLTNTQKVSMDRMFIQNTGQSGVGGTQVVDFTFTNGFINNSGTSYPANPKNDSSIGFGFDAAATENNLSGVVTITGNTLTNATEHGVDIQNFAGTITNATITNNTITSATSSANTHGSGIRLLGFGHSSGVSNITKATISGNTILNFPGGAGITAQYGNVAAGGPPGVWGTPGDATNIILIQSNFINGQSAANPVGANAILMTLTGRGKANWKADSNGSVAKPISNIGGTEIGVTVRGANSNSSTDVTDATCDITNNRITGIVSVNAQAIVFAADWLTTTTDKPHLKGIVANNTVSGQDGEGITALATPGGSASVDVDIHHNNIGQPNCAGCNRFAITAQVGTSSATTTGTPSMCLNIHDNTAQGSGVNPGIGIRKKTAAYVFGILNLPAGSTATPNLEAYINGLNPAGGGTTLISQTSGFTSCASAPIAGIAPTAQRDELALNDVFQNNDLGLLSTFSNLKTDLSSIYEGVNSLNSSMRFAPVVSTTGNTQSAQLVAEAETAINGEALSVHANDTAVTGSKSAQSEQTATETLASGRVWSAIAHGDATVETAGADEVFSSHAGSPAQADSPFKGASAQSSINRLAEVKVAATSSDEASLSHAASERTGAKDYFVSMLPMLAPNPPGSFPLNGTGAGFKLPAACAVCAPGVGKTITVTFKATLNNPPNLTVTPPRVIAQGTLSGAFTGNPLATDDPATATFGDATVTAVDLFDTSTTLGASPNPSFTSQSVTFTATVTSTGGTPTGTVQFKDGVSNLGSPQTLNGSGIATLSTSALSTASHSITAQYSGSGSFEAGPVSNTITQVVNQSGTSTALTTSGSPSTLNQNVTFTATVTSSTLVTGPPTGTVQFKDGVSNLGSPVALNGSGVATFSTSSLSTGAAHSITAVYSGDTNFATSTSSAVSQQVNTAGTATGLTTSGSPSFSGDNVTFTATVTSTAGTPTGQVQFKDDVTNLGSPVTLNGSGVATLSTSALSVGIHPITAHYLGSVDTVFDPSTSSIVQQEVTTCVSAAVVTNTDDNVASGDPVVPGSLRAAINSVCAGGTITFNIPISDPNYDSGTGVYTIKLKSGELAIDKNLTITGPSAAKITVSRDSAAATQFRIFHITDGTVGISNLTVSGGTQGSGGGLFVTGASTNVTVTGMLFTGNSVANGSGGGLGLNAGTLNVVNTTVSGNTSTNGGGVYNGGGTLNLTSVTVTGNNANGDVGAGACPAAGSVNGEGGGIDNSGGNPTFVKNSIIAGNTACNTSLPDITGTLDAAGEYNLIGACDGCALLPANHNQMGTAATPLDALLDPLAYNGGPTKTHALKNASPALETGKAYTLTTDQRGLPRPVDSDATTPAAGEDDSDIGAFERQNPAGTPNTPDLVDASDTGTSNSDNLTNDNSPTFDISGVTPGATVELLRAVGANPATVVASGVASSSTITLTDLGPVAAGTYHYSAQQTVGTDTSTASTPVLDVTIDITPNTPDLVNASDTGLDNQDNITNDNSPTFDITGVAVGGTVELLRTTGANPPVMVASGVASSSTITLTDPGPVASGTHAYSARQTVSGSTSAASAGLNVTIQTTPDAPNLVDASDTGVSNTDNNTNDNSPTFDISGVVTGAMVELLRDGSPIQSGTASSGTITLTDPGPVSGGPALDGVLHSYTARQTISGGTSPESLGLGVTVDTTLPTPSVPDLKPTTDTTDNDNGTSTTDDRTNASSRDFTIAGSDTGSTRVLLRDSNPVSNPDTGALSDGVYQYSTRETDKAGNVGTSGSLPVTFDNSAPLVSSVTRVDANPTTASTVHFTVTFNEAVTGVDAADFSPVGSGSVSGASVTGVTPVDSSHYTVTVNTGTGDGTLRLDVVATDAVTPIKDAMNITFAGAFTTGAVYTIDRLNPYVLSVVRANPSPTGAGTVNFTVTFSEAVQVSTVGSGDFALTTTGGIAGASIGAITPATPTNSSQFNVAVNTGTGNGTIRLDVTDDDSITDVQGKPLSPSPGTGTGNGAFTTGQVYTIDKTVPTVTLTLAAGETDPTSNTTINFTATFSKPVSGFNPSGVQITGTANATVANITPVDSQNYTVGISGMNQSGSVTVKIPAAAAEDDAANPNTASNSLSVTYIQNIYTTFEVNTTADTDDGLCTALGTGNGCTLREAIKLANADGGVETITFNIPGADAGCSGGVCTITLGSALDNISSSMTIDGPGANVLTVKRSTVGGTPEFRIFTIASGNNDVTIEGLTLSNGDAALLTPGGGILDSSAGTVNVTNSTISGNTALQGGGINRDGAGTLNVTNSTISGNTGAQGGGINISSAGPVNLINSTVSGNFVTDSGGGISTVSATLTITNSTINNNRADSNNNGTGTGGGLSQTSGTVTLKSTIVAGNFNDASPSITADDIAGTMDAASSFNLIGTGGSGGLVNATNSNQVGVSDPGLFPLAFNGGTTQTHALQCVSSAIDKGYSFGQTTDQTGLSRTFDLADAVYPNAAAPGDGTDIGAFESQSGGGCIPKAIAPSPAPSTNEDTQVTITLKGTYAQNTTLTFTISQQPGHGTSLVPTAPVCNFTTFQTCTSTVSYTPSANYNGADDFKFKVSAGGLDSDAADVAITVNPINDAPLAASQAVGTNEDTPVTITLAGSDIDSAALTFSIVSAPSHGSLGSISAPVCIAGTCSATVDYTPTANYGGPDNFTFKTNDGSANSNPVGTVTISVNPQNDSPVLDNTGNMTLTAINEDVADASNPGTLVSAIISSAGGDRITDVDVGASEGLAVTAVDNTNGTWQYSINNGVNWLPFGSVDQTTARHLTANANTRVRFIPNANFNGTVNPGLTFRAWDLSNGGGLNGNTGDATPSGATSPYSAATETASITVNPINDAPTADSQAVSTNEDTPKSVTLTGTDVETSAANMIFTITQQPAHGVLSGTGANRTYTPNADYNGADSFKFTITDAGDGSAPALTTADATVSITVNAINDAPVNTVPVAQSVIENDSLTLSSAHSNQLQIADVDAGSSPVQVTLSVTNGTLSLNTVAGLSFTVGDGVTDPTMTFTGTVANINIALNGMVFMPTHGFDGTATLQLITNDQGNAGSGGALSDTDTVNINILDGGTLALSSATYTVDEAAGTTTITVNRTGGSHGEARINYATSDGTATAGAGKDYLSSTGQLIFADGVTTQTFTVAINDDALNEAAETINLTLSNVQGSGAPGAPLTAVLTITDNDAQPSISINDVSQNEGNSGTTNFVFTVTLSAASGQNVTVNYQTANGTATAPSDYLAIPSTAITFLPGETSKSVIVVVVNGDTTAEDDETFFVNLSGAVNATIADNQGLGKILSEDTPLVQFSSSTYTVQEDGSRVFVRVNRLGDMSKVARVDYSTSDPSGLNNCDQVTGIASSRCDYATTVGTLRFAAGEAFKDIAIPIVNDVYLEGGKEDFTITLSNPVGAEISSPSSATISILDSDNGLEPNPIDNDAFFIRQLYIDFLGREPEPGAVNNWLGVLNHCAVPTDCDRNAVAQGFVRSAEFRDRGYFVYRFYSASLGRLPLYSEFIPDMARASGFLSDQDLEANKAAYIDEFMNRQEFKNLYDVTLNNPTAYVDKLLATAVLPNHPRRAEWIAGLTNNTLTRAQVLRQFVESTEVFTKFYNEAFIVMNYFGFLRRNPDAAYQAWIQIFNNTNDDRVIINGFINSQEYRFRFGH